MTVAEFIPEAYSEKISEGKVTWQAPSNIALVKYWGKKENQIPANPSISFTLNSCRTTTSLSFQARENRDEDYEFQLLFEKERKDSFRPKIEQFFKRIEQYLPFLRDYSFRIDTSNSFPHSSGIASSASGMSALALCLMSLERMLNPGMTEAYFIKKASFLARLGSGSACRSIEGELVVWGKHENINGSSDLFGTRYSGEVHPIFNNYQDSILLVDKGEKKVSSTVGHELMNGHPFAEKRFEQAHENIDKLRDIIRTGDLDAFIKVVESEALSLHAMMMTGQPYFLLMKPNTLEIINRIMEFRNSSGLHLCFTLDAGANVHLLYPEGEKEAVQKFIQEELSQFCQNGQFIHDQTGKGASEML